MKCVKFNIEGPVNCVRLNLVKLMSKGIKDFRAFRDDLLTFEGL